MTNTDITSSAIFSAFVALVIWSVFAKRKRRQREKNRIESLIASALPSLDRIVKGQRYVGSESQVLKTERFGGFAFTELVSGSPGMFGRRRPLRISRYVPHSAVQLCRTKRGAWFLFDPDSCKVTPCDETEAKSRLADDLELYTRTFGAPNIV